MIRAATLADIPALARLHAASFAFPTEYWNADMLGESLAVPGTFLLAVWEGQEPSGFILFRAVADIAEILTLAVAPAQQRKGIASRLIKEAIRTVTGKGPTALLLDVAEDNASARALYTARGFREIGRRKGYYTRPAGRVDSLTMRLVLDIVL